MPKDFEIVGQLRDIEEIEEGEIEIPDGTSRFVICIDNAEYLFSLTTLKVYSVIDDPRGEEVRWIRIIDDSGEDYLYNARRFVVVTVAQSEAHALVEAMRETRRTHDSSRGDDTKRSEEHTSELQSRENLVCRLLLEKKNT